MRYCAVFEAFRSVVTAEGVGGLYKGFWPTLMRDIPEIAIQVCKLCCEGDPLISGVYGGIMQGCVFQ